MVSKTPIADEGWLQYQPSFLGVTEAEAYFATLSKTIPWRQEGSRGRLFPRLVAWYGDPGVVYSYSGIAHQPLPWTSELLEIRDRIECQTHARLNSVLLNFYRTGQDSMGFHADDEPELGHNPTIASLSLGAERRFVLKHNTTNEKVEYLLGNGSLLVMGGSCQHFWKHTLPKTKKPVGPRINLTFRHIRPPDESIRESD